MDAAVTRLIALKTLTGGGARAGRARTVHLTPPRRLSWTSLPTRTSTPVITTATLTSLDA